jgi:hypothetical protein
MNKIFCVFVFFLMFSVVKAEEGMLDNILPNKNLIYIIKLHNGDILSGYVVEMVNHPDEGEGIKFSTEMGTATIYESQIEIIKPYFDYYKHNHRIFLQPTAEPIGSNHFVGNFELLFFYAGAGIYDIVSITAGRSMIPAIRSDQQLNVLNTKFTVLEMPLNSPARKLSFALGANLGFVNHDNRMIHYYGVGTFSMTRSVFSAIMFYKAGSDDYYKVRMGANSIDMNYADGSFGLGIGIDSRFSSMHDLHFIGELWNSDVTRPTHSAVMLGLRLCSSNFSADFGLSFFTQPFVAPFCSFVWTPFD